MLLTLTDYSYELIDHRHAVASFFHVFLQYWSEELGASIVAGLGASLHPGSVYGCLLKSSLVGKKRLMACTGWNFTKSEVSSCMRRLTVSLEENMQCCSLLKHRAEFACSVSFSVCSTIIRVVWNIFFSTIFRDRTTVFGGWHWNAYQPFQAKYGISPA